MGNIRPYPLHFQPEFKERVWGGRALERFGFEVPAGAIGEGWMIADHPNGVSHVTNGPLAGKGLDEIRELTGDAWFGAKGAASGNGRFPLLVKLLDCNDDLSIQVHPNDSYERLPQGELGKTEMWYVLAAKPEAKIIYGLEPGTDRTALAKAIDEGRIMDTLQAFSVKAGDSFYIPAGTVHALCAGVVVAEIQQNSDTTYRLFDYDRPGLDGQPRELHIEDSLNVIAYEGSGATRMATDGVKPGEWLQLAASPYFTTDKGVVNGHWTLETDGNSFVILIICDGAGSIEWSDGVADAKAGDCFLVPANLGQYALEGAMTVLCSVVP